jgi:peptide/nickel transport system substrate-binding protein
MSLAEVGEWHRAGKPTGVRATDQTKRKQLADEVQRVALSEVPYVPWGEWVQPTAFRNNIKDILKFEAPIFWGI